MAIHAEQYCCLLTLKKIFNVLRTAQIILKCPLPPLSQHAALCAVTNTHTRARLVPCVCDWKAQTKTLVQTSDRVVQLTRRYQVLVQLNYSFRLALEFLGIVKLSMFLFYTVWPCVIKTNTETILGTTVHNFSVG